MCPLTKALRCVFPNPSACTHTHIHISIFWGAVVGRESTAMELFFSPSKGVCPHTSLFRSPSNLRAENSADPRRLKTQFPVATEGLQSVCFPGEVFSLAYGLIVQLCKNSTSWSSLNSERNQNIQEIWKSFLSILNLSNMGRGSIRCLWAESWRQDCGLMSNLLLSHVCMGEWALCSRSGVYCSSLFIWPCLLRAQYQHPHRQTASHP